MPRTKALNPAYVASQSHDPQQTEAPKRAKTRKPPSVRERERRQQENVAPGSSSPSPLHTRPALSVASAEEVENSDYIGMLMEHVHSAIHTQNWGKLGDLVESISDPDKGFHLDEVADHPSVKKLLAEGALRVLTAHSPPSYTQLSLALDLLVMGADMNAKDQQGNSVLNILRRAMDNRLREFIVNDHPYFKKLFFDQTGRPIPAE